MDRQKLDSFIRRIVVTSEDPLQARLALDRLKEILTLELTEEDLAQFTAATEGVADSLPGMKEALKESSADGDAMQAAAAKAKQRRIWEEEAARRGRC